MMSGSIDQELRSWVEYEMRSSSISADSIAHDRQFGFIPTDTRCKPMYFQAQKRSNCKPNMVALCSTRTHLRSLCPTTLARVRDDTPQLPRLDSANCSRCNSPKLRSLVAQ